MENEKDGTVYIKTIKTKQCNFKERYSIYAFSKTEQGYSEAIKVDIDSDYFLFSTVLAQDGETLYFSAARYSAITMYQDGYELNGLHIYQGILKQNKLTDVKLIDELEDNSLDLIQSIGSDQSLYYIKSVESNEDVTNILIKASIQDGKYTTETLSFNKESNNFDRFFYLEENEKMYCMDTADGNSISNSYITDFSQNTINNPRNFQIPKEIQNETLLAVSQSNHGNTIYLLTYLGGQDYSTAKIYKVPVSSFLESCEEWENVNNNELLAYYKQLIKLRNTHKAISQGKFTAFDIGNSSLFAYELTSDDEKLLVIHNMSRKEIAIESKILIDKEIIYSENFDHTNLGDLSTVVLKEIN